MRVAGLDHLVLSVADVERSLRFYQETLGLDPVRVDEWRRGEVPFPSVRVDASTIIDLVPGHPGGEGAARNLDHLCFVVDPDDWEAAVESGSFDVVDGPGPRFGAQGTGLSIYVRDPDGNVVELRHYRLAPAPSQ